MTEAAHRSHPRRLKSSHSDPVVTVLITTRNRRHDLEATLKELSNQNYPELRLLVIDDASDEPLEPAVRKNWPTATVIRNSSNLGLIASRSLGMSNAAGEFILSLDDDSCLTRPDDLQRAIARMRAEPSIGVITFRVEEPFTMGEFSTQGEERYLHTFTGCAHLIRKKVVDQIGGYRDFFFYYGEESEYGLRVLAFGWKILMQPSVVVRHRVSAIGRSEGRIVAHRLRNNLWTVLLHMPWHRVPIEVGWKVLVGSIETVRQLEFRRLGWAMVSFVRGLPAIMRIRRPISAETLRLYDAMRFRGGVTAEEYDNPRPLSAADLWRWVQETWWHRRRAKAIWEQPVAPPSPQR